MVNPSFPLADANIEGGGGESALASPVCTVPAPCLQMSPSYDDVVKTCKCSFFNILSATFLEIPTSVKGRKISLVYGTSMAKWDWQVCNLIPTLCQQLKEWFMLCELLCLPCVCTIQLSSKVLSSCCGKCLRTVLSRKADRLLQALTTSR